MFNWLNWFHVTVGEGIVVDELVVPVVFGKASNVRLLLFDDVDKEDPFASPLFALSFMVKCFCGQTRWKMKVFSERSPSFEDDDESDDGLMMFVNNWLSFSKWPE